MQNIDADRPSYTVANADAKDKFDGSNKTHLPAYQRIKISILKNIHEGFWQTGDAIPTEYALAQQFGVSRMTVNRALKELSEERVLERRQGSGTFVAQQQFNHTFVEVRNIAEDIRSNHQHYEAQVVSQQRLTPSTLPNTERPLFDDLASQVDEVKIVHIADGVPIQFEERWVNADLVTHFIHQDFTQTNTSDYLIEKIPLERGDYKIQALPATKDIAEALALTAGEPVLLLRRQTYSQGQIVTVVNMWHAGSRYQFSGTL